MNSMSSSGMPVCSASWRIPYALSMPRWVMSTDVEPPERTSRSGSCAATASRSLLFFSPVGSHAFLATRGARWPSAEKVICDPRSSRMSPQVSASHSPRRLASPSTASQRAGLLVVGQRVRVDGDDAVVLEPVVLRAAGGEQVDVRERLGGGIRQSLDDLDPELLELTPGDDRHLDTFGQGDQQRTDAGIDGGFRRGQRVVEVERDKAGSSVGHGSPVSSGGTRKAPPGSVEPLCCRGDRI